MGESEQSGRHGDNLTMLVPVSSPLEDDGGKTEAKEQACNERETVIVTMLFCTIARRPSYQLHVGMYATPSQTSEINTTTLEIKLRARFFTPTTSMPEGVHSNTLFYLLPETITMRCHDSCADPTSTVKPRPSSSRHPPEDTRPGVLRVRADDWLCRVTVPSGPHLAPDVPRLFY